MHMQKIGEAMQQAGAQQQQAPNAGNASKEKPDIEEADVEILDGDKK